MNSRYQLAQLNVAVMREPLDAPVMSEFVAALDRINALADAAPGFLWRLQGDEGDATTLRPFGDEMLVNLSVWRDVASLHDYVYRSGHLEVMRRRREWFGHLDEAYLVLWWVPAGHRPTAVEARQRLDRLRAEGPGPDAFTFKRAWPAPDAGERAAAGGNEAGSPAG